MDNWYIYGEKIIQINGGHISHIYEIWKGRTFKNEKIDYKIIIL